MSGGQRPHDVMRETCHKCGGPPTIRDLIGGEGMTMTPNGPECSDCWFIGLDLLDDNSPGRMSDVCDQPLIRCTMPASIDRAKTGDDSEYLNSKDRAKMEKWMRKHGLITPDGKQRFWTGERMETYLKGNHD